MAACRSLGADGRGAAPPLAGRGQVPEGRGGAGRRYVVVAGLAPGGSVTQGRGG